MTVKRVRGEGGFSLVTVLSVTLLASLWLAAATANLIIVYRAASASKFAGEIASYADSATDYVVEALNDPVNKSNFDNQTVSLEGPKFGAPDSLIVTCTTQTIFPPTTSSIYDGTSGNTATQQYSLFGVQTWRVVQTSARYAGLVKVVQVILGPPAISLDQSIPPTKLIPGPNVPFGSPNGATPFFNSALLTTGAMSIGSNFTSSGFDSTTQSPVMATDNVHALGGDIVSYAPVTFSGNNVNIGGSLSAMSINGGGSSPVTAQTELPSGTSVNRFLTTSGDVSGFSDNSGNFGTSAPNVLGLTNSTFGTVTNAYIQTGQDAATAQAQNPLAPAPAASGNAIVLNADGSFGSNGKPISGADYSANTIVVPTSSNLSVAGATPVRIYLNDSAGAGTVAQINGIVNAAGNPSTFQIFYGGTGVIDLRGSTFNGTIYAPNSTVYMMNTNVYGAIVANKLTGGLDSNNNTLTAQNVNLVFDTSLKSPSALKNNNVAGLLYDPNAIKQLVSNSGSASGTILAVRYYSEQGRLH